MTVLFSQPLTLKTRPRLPASYQRWASEAKLSHDFGLRYPAVLAEPLVGSHVALHLLRERHRHRALITGRYGELFAAVQGLLPIGRKPLLLLDVEWPDRGRGPLRRWLSGIYHRAVARGAWRIQVFCESEADDYARYFGIPRERFVWLPYCVDLDDHQTDVRDGDYVFSGGAHDRDHATLAEAVRDLPYPVRVATPREQFTADTIPSNMEVLGRVDRGTFFRQMAGARLVVLSLRPGLLRCPGVITYVSALRLGKCVIVNEPRGAASYISDGETGFLIPPNNPAALAAIIQQLWDDHGRRRRVAAQAAADAAQRFSLARYERDVERLVELAAGPGRAGGDSPPCPRRAGSDSPPWMAPTGDCHRPLAKLASTEGYRPPLASDTEARP